MNRKDAATSAGMTLVEMLAYVATLTVIINLAAGTFASGLRLDAAANAVVADLNTQDAIRADFLDTVRLAVRVCPQAGAFRSGDEQVVFELPRRPDVAEQHRYAVFGRFDDGRPYRLVLSDEGRTAPVIVQTTAYPRAFASVRFRYDVPEASQARLVTVELESARNKRGNRPPAVYVYTASLRLVEREG